MRRGGGSTTYGHNGTKLGGKKKKERSRSRSQIRAHSASPVPKKKKAVSRERERSPSGSRKPSPHRGRNVESKALLDWRKNRRSPSRRGASPQRRSVSASPMRRATPSPVPRRGVSPGRWRGTSGRALSFEKGGTHRKEQRPQRSVMPGSQSRATRIARSPRGPRSRPDVARARDAAS